MDLQNDFLKLGSNQGHFHGGQSCHGHDHDKSNHDNSHAVNSHGHSHGGQPCHGHGDNDNIHGHSHDFDDGSYEKHHIKIIPNKFFDKSKYMVKSEFELDGLKYVEYKDERQMPLIMNLITKDLSEPYSIYTYRYFIHNWPFLCYLVLYFYT